MISLSSGNAIIAANSKPYPPVQAARKNPYYANMIIPAIRDQSSELTAITTYLYQHWVLDDEFSLLAQTLMDISKVEMHHLQMLGQLITILGGDPRFAQNACKCWSGQAVSYTRDMKELLTNNITAEEEAAKFYQQTARNIKDPHVCAILNRIALDELLHAEIFQDFLDKETC